MAIPKLLDKMRHSVQDTGDEMTGRLSVNADGVDIIDSAYATLRLGNNDENDLIIGKNSLLDNVLITADGGIQLTSGTNKIAFASKQGSITGIADPVEAQDVATKNYVDKSGLALINIESTDGLTYTGTSESISEYKEGMIIGLIPNMHSAASTAIKNITININDLGPLMLSQYFIKKEHAYNGLGCWSANTAVEASFLYAEEAFIGQMQLDSSGSWYILPINPGLRLIEITNGTLGYNLSVTASSAYLNNNILRNITASTSAPTSSDGNVGDIWIQYFE